MNLKKVINLVILSLFLIFIVTSCKNSQNESSNYLDWENMSFEQKVTVPNEVLLEDNKLIVATSPDFSPYEFKDINQKGNKQFQGADIVLAKFLADTMGLKLEITEASFDGLVIELNVDKADLVLAGLTYSESRAKNFSFTDVYFEEKEENSQVLVVLKDNLTNFNSYDKLNNENTTIAAQAGSIQEELRNKQLPNAKKWTIQKINDGVIQLLKGSVDAIALSLTNAKLIVDNNPSLTIVTDFYFDAVEYQGNRGLLKKDNSLVTYINEALTYLDNETYANWLNISRDYAIEIGLGETNDSNFFVKFATVLSDYSLEFLKGTGITLLLSAVTVIFGTIIAVILQLIRKSRFLFLRSIGNVYVEFVRGIPLLLLLWLLYMLAPSTWPPILSVGIALFLNSGAYVAEIIRAGILGVDKGQYEAARALGLSKFKTFKKIIFPQATKKILPALGNEFVALIKETSLASVFFIGDLMTVKNNITSITYLSIEPFIIVGVIYFILTFGTTKIIKYFEMKLEV